MYGTSVGIQYNLPSKQRSLAQPFSKLYAERLSRHTTLFGFGLVNVYGRIETSLKYLIIVSYFPGQPNGPGQLLQ